jgi:hypothetical protein
MDGETDAVSPGKALYGHQGLDVAHKRALLVSGSALVQFPHQK